jgi:hypothetical protein
MRVVSHVYRNDLRANVNVQRYYQVVSIMSDMFCTIYIKSKTTKSPLLFLNHHCTIVTQMSIIVRVDETKINLSRVCV